LQAFRNIWISEIFPSFTEWFLKHFSVFTVAADYQIKGFCTKQGPAHQAALWIGCPSLKVL
jgi:hypothetical protein